LNLSVISVGHVHTEAIEPLTSHLSRLEQVVTNLDARTRLADHRPEINRAVDAAANDWVLLIREREVVDAGLAAEIAAATAAAQSWGFRIRTEALYAGKPLRLGGDPEGELRLFHRRHLLRRGEMMVEGTVVRMRNAFKAVTFASYAEHRAYLVQTAVPHSMVRRVLLFARNARTLDVNTLRYLWIEAGYDAS
jgi:hypothetical protein